MTLDSAQTYTAFAGPQFLARGDLEVVALTVRQRLKNDPASSVLVFSDLTGKQMDFDLSGTEKAVRQRLQVYLAPDVAFAARPAGPGRPKLGVQAREVSLLPRHWEWLSAQDGGASATLRRLVDEARKQVTGRERVRQAQERAHKFMTAMAGDLPGFEEALRALYAKDAKKFRLRLEAWPRDVRDYAESLASPAFE